MRPIHYQTFATLLMMMSAMVALPPQQAQAEMSISVNLFEPVSVPSPPPPLPVYEVPVPPQDNYVWMPGYWRWDGRDYYWVPGAWVEAPQPDYYWTPGYWAFVGNAYRWNEGYWGPHVGFYGGINYGGGYDGRGFHGGSWNQGRYVVDRSVTNVTINKTVVNNYISYNGGPHGVQAREDAEQAKADREKHIAQTQAQRERVEQAAKRPELKHAENRGRPTILATQRANSFTPPDPKAIDAEHKAEYQQRQQEVKDRAAAVQSGQIGQAHKAQFDARQEATKERAVQVQQEQQRQHMYTTKHAVPQVKPQAPKALPQAPEIERKGPGPAAGAQEHPHRNPQQERHDQ